MPTVASILPADDAVGVLNNQPVQVELTRSDSTDYEKMESSEADFAAGTLADLEARPTNDLALAYHLAILDTYEADTVGSLPSGYTLLTGSGITVENKDAQKAIKLTGSNGWRVASRNVPSLQADWDMYFDCNADVSGSNLMLWVRFSGSWGSHKGVRVEPHWNAQKLYVYETSGGADTLLGQPAKTLSTATWYRVRLQVIGSAVKARIWARGSAEPGTWDVDTTTSILTAGQCAISAWYGGPEWIDNLQTVSQVTGYLSSGSRISPGYSLATVGKAGIAYLEFDTTIPAQTTLTLKTSLDGGANWSSACTSGQRIAGITEGDDLSAVSISLKAELATTNIAVTPALLEVRLIFMPVDPTLAEVKVDTVAFSIDGGNLCYWKTAKHSGGTVVDPCYQDVYVATVGQWYAYGSEQVTVEVWYDGNLISTTTFSTEAWETYWAHGSAQFMALARGGVYDGPMSGYAHFFVTKFEDYLCRAELHYLIAEVPRGAFDGRYWVAHLVVWDGPGAAAVGQPALADGAGAMAVQGWCRGDAVAAVMVQGYVRGDGPGAAAAARPMQGDGPAAAIVATPAVEDGPAAVTVYEVNRRNVVEIKSISAATKAVMDDLGLELSDE